MHIAFLAKSHSLENIHELYGDEMLSRFISTS
jgi:hypothetical protein